MVRPEEGFSRIVAERCALGVLALAERCAAKPAVATAAV